MRRAQVHLVHVHGDAAAAVDHRRPAHQLLAALVAPPLAERRDLGGRDGHHNVLVVARRQVEGEHVARALGSRQQAEARPPGRLV